MILSTHYKQGVGLSLSLAKATMASAALMLSFSLRLPPPTPSSSSGRLPSDVVQFLPFSRACSLKLSSSRNFSGFAPILPLRHSAFNSPSPNRPLSLTVVSAKGYKMKTHKVPLSISVSDAIWGLWSHCYFSGCSFNSVHFLSCQMEPLFSFFFFLHYGGGRLEITFEAIFEKSVWPQK